MADLRRKQLKEFVESQTADTLDIDNRPDWEAVINLRNLCREVLQPLRDYEGKPIHVNSGYRCPELNEAVHGVGDSQHLYGEAADIHLPDKETGRRWYKFLSLKARFYAIDTPLVTATVVATISLKAKTIALAGLKTRLDSSREILCSIVFQ